MKKENLDEQVQELMELFRIEKLICEYDVPYRDVAILEKLAIKGVPRAEYDYGMYYLLIKFNYREGMKWLKKCESHANDYFLKKISFVYSRFGS